MYIHSIVICSALSLTFVITLILSLHVFTLILCLQMLEIFPSFALIYLKIALCGLRWFKLNVSKYQKRCQVVKKMSSCQKDVKCQK